MSNLYHYCSTSSFLALIQNRSLWLSSLSLSNDTMEGKILRSTAQKIIRKQNLTDEQAADLYRAINEVEELLDGLGFCLSEAPDLLSQWRGYADDGRGFSIGFAESYLRALSEDTGSGNKFFIEKVIYDEEEQIEIVEDTFREAIECIKAGKLTAPPLPGLLSLATPDTASEAQEQYRIARKEHSAAVARLNYQALLSFNHLYKLKNTAFAEEKEWRLISYFIKLWKNKLGVGVKENCLYRAESDRLIPYREYALKDLGLKNPPIVEVILGPKNTTPIDVVEHLLLQNNFSILTHVRRSDATYR